MTQTSSQPSTGVALEARAQRFSRIVLDHAFDEHDLMRVLLRFDDLAPLRHEDVDPGMYHPRGVDLIEFLTYEDTGIALGSYLTAQCLRYRVTADPDARAAADRAYRGVRCTYQLGRATREGHYPKPYGGRNSDQVSRDQYLFTLVGLDLYHDFVEPHEQRTIQHMIGHMAAYWIDCNYTTRYYDLPPASHLDDFMASLFLGVMAIAHARTGDARFGREYDRLLHDEQLDQRIGLTLREQYRRGRTYDGGMLFRQHENPTMMKTLALDVMWRTDPARRALCREALQRYRDDDLFATFDPKTRLNYFCTGYDPASDTIHTTEPGEIAGMSNPLNLKGLTFGGRRLTAGSAKTAACALLIADRLGDTHLAAVAHDILAAMPLEAFRLMTAPGPEHIPPTHAWETRALNCAALCQWQWAYWLARDRA